MLFVASPKRRAMPSTRGGGLGTEFSGLLSLHKESLARSINCALSWHGPPPPGVFSFLPRGAFANDAIPQSLLDFAPDRIFCYGSGILGHRLLEVFAGRIVGSHQGLPQYYRGSGSNFFAFQEGRASAMGVSFHLVDEGVDTGAILAQIAPVPSPFDTYYTHSAELVLLTIRGYEQIAGMSELPIPMPLPTHGRFCQRKDFTGDRLRAFFSMIAEKSFFGWHAESTKAHGRPILVGSGNSWLT